MKRKKDIYVLFGGRKAAQIPGNSDARLNIVTIRYDIITCRDIAFSDRAIQPLSLFFHFFLTSLLSVLKLELVLSTDSFSLLQEKGVIAAHPHEVIHCLSWLSFAKGEISDEYRMGNKVF